jgi:hypothetical protein
MSSPGYNQSRYFVNPAFAVSPFETVQGTLIGTDVVCILPASIYPRQLLGMTISGPASATEFDVCLSSPANQIDSTNQTASARLQYPVPYFLPPNTQIFCFWRNASAVSPVAATIAEVLSSMAQSTTQSVSTAVGTIPGDMLYVFHYDAFMNSNGETINMTAPSGTLGTGAWIPIVASANGAGACGTRLWKATTVANGAHLVTTNQLDGSSSNGIIVVRARGVTFDAAAAGQAKSAGSVGAAVIAPDIPGGVTQQAQDTLFRLYALNNGTSTPSPSFGTPAGYTPQVNLTRSFNDEDTLFKQVMAAGATSVGAVTSVNAQTQADAWAAITLLIRGTAASTATAGSVTFQLAAA